MAHYKYCERVYHGQDASSQPAEQQKQGRAERPRAASPDPSSNGIELSPTAAALKKQDDADRKKDSDSSFDPLTAECPPPSPAELRRRKRAARALAHAEAEAARRLSLIHI